MKDRDRGLPAILGEGNPNEILRMERDEARDTLREVAQWLLDYGFPDDERWADCTLPPRRLVRMMFSMEGAEYTVTHPTSTYGARVWRAGL